MVLKRVRQCLRAALKHDSEANRSTQTATLVQRATSSIGSHRIISRRAISRPVWRNALK